MRSVLLYPPTPRDATGSDYCCIYVAGKYLQSLPMFTGEERAGRAQTGSSIGFNTEIYLKLFN